MDAGRRTTLTGTAPALVVVPAVTTVQHRGKVVGDTTAMPIAMDRVMIKQRAAHELRI